MQTYYEKEEKSHKKEREQNEKEKETKFKLVKIKLEKEKKEREAKEREAKDEREMAFERESNTRKCSRSRQNMHNMKPE